MNARLNITYQGQNGDAPDLIPFDATDADVKQMATEMIQTGGIRGIATSPDANFRDFVVERFAATDDLPALITLRPKVAFGR